MPLAAFSTQTYDLAGSVVLDRVSRRNSNLETYTRRLTRNATLDTGAYIDDRGYSHGDRTIDLSAQGDADLFDSLVYLIQNYSRIWIFLPDGAFTGNIKQLRPSNGRILITLLIEASA